MAKTDPVETSIPEEEAGFLPTEETFEDIAEDVFELTAEHRLELHRELLEKEIELMRVRLAVVRTQLKRASKSGFRCANASARSQLYIRPWTKLGILAAGSFFATLALRKASPGPLMSAATPILLQLARSDLSLRR